MTEQNSDQGVQEKVIRVNGEDIRVFYRVKGNDIEIIQAQKQQTSASIGETQQSNTEQQKDAKNQETQQGSAEQQKDLKAPEAKNIPVRTTEVTSAEMEKIKETLKQEQKTEKKNETQDQKKQESLGYKDVGGIADRIDYDKKVEKHAGEFRDLSHGPIQDVRNKQEYREHAVKTMEDPKTTCFVGQAGSDKNALFFYNRETNTFVVVPEDKQHSATMFRPLDFEGRFNNKYEKQEITTGQRPEIKQGVHELLPGLEKSQAQDQTPEQAKRARIDAAWDQRAAEAKERLGENVEKGHIKPEDRSGEEKRIDKIIEEGRKRELAREFGQNQQDVTEQKQKSGSPSHGRGVLHYPYMPIP